LEGLGCQCASHVFILHVKFITIQLVHLKYKPYRKQITRRRKTKRIKRNYENRVEEITDKKNTQLYP
jgi:hypothetical protein